jgi:hypothetical protein
MYLESNMIQTRQGTIICNHVIREKEGTTRGKSLETPQKRKKIERGKSGLRGEIEKRGDD